LLLDPWGKERFDRIIRENARLQNVFLDYVHKSDSIREALAIMALPAVVGAFLK
jgi:hypothetical protein